MKQKYERPVVEVHHFRLRQRIMESSYIPVGGGGKFDVKQELYDWEIDWDGTHRNSVTDDNQYSIF